MHSWRKGSTSAAASGSTCAPSIVTICLRTGWKISQVLSKYLFMENAGDHFCGRVAAGLDPHTRGFTVLPPRFRKNLTPDEQEFVDRVYKSVFPNGTQWGPHMGPILRNLLATLGYHAKYLQELPGTHAWHSTYLGLQPDILLRLHSMVELVYSGDDKDAK